MGGSCGSDEMMVGVRWPSALPLCREAARSTDREAENCTAVKGTGSETYFSHLKEG